MLLLCLCLFMQQPEAPEPWGIISSPSVTVARAGVKHYLSRSGKKELVATMDSTALTDLLTGRLQGLELQKPVGGFFVTDISTNTASFIAFVPMTKEEEFLKFLDQHLLKPQPVSANLWEVSVPLLGKTHLRFQHGYAFFAPPAMDATPLPDPIKWLPKEHSEQNLTVSLYPDRIPPRVRQNLLQWGQQLLLPSGETKPVANKEKRMQAGQAAGVSLLGGMLSHFSGQTREVHLAVKSDSRADQFLGSMVVVPQPGSSLQAHIEQLQPNQFAIPASLFASKKDVSEEHATRAKKLAFTKPEQEQVTVQQQGGSQWQGQVRFSGALLQYRDELDKDPKRVQRELERKERRERRRDR